MSAETRDTLLYGQIQEGLTYTLVKSTAVSGARSYSELCLAAARNEERRLTELHRHQHYQQDSSSTVHRWSGNISNFTGEGCSSQASLWTEFIQECDSN